VSETGRATAPGAGTVLNALATHRGAAFAIDVETTAIVERRQSGITGAIEGDADADTALIERCVELAAATTDTDLGGAHVRTESDVPTAAGLKSSSAAANAAVLATLDLLDERMEPADAARLGVRAARETGVTATGAFDDAGASMLGGLVVTDNDDDELLKRDAVDWDVLVWTPPERAHSADADVTRCERIAPMAELAFDLAMAGDYGRAMTVNGLAFSAALAFPTEPAVEAMPHAAGVSLSGTGPSVLAVGERATLEPVAERWRRRDGRTWFTRTRTEGARQR
jgi:shikimate kinase